MSLNRKAATDVVKQEKEALDWGNLDPKQEYEGRLVYVADLGLQRHDYAGEFTGNYQQISLGIEAIGEGVKNEEGDMIPRVLWTKPFYIYKTMGPKSKEFEFYSLFEPAAVENSVPDWGAQLGKPCSIKTTLINGKGENKGKTFDNIKNLMQIPEKYQAGVGEALTEVGIGNSDDENDRVTKALFGLPHYVWKQRIIEDTPEAPEEKVEAPVEGDDSPF